MEAYTPTTQGSQSATAKPNGPVAAAILATGIGSLVLGILTVLAEGVESIHTALEFSEKVGPLSGKTIIAVIAYFVSWLLLHAGLKNKDVDLKKVATVTAVLIVLALILTFPPVFLAFAPEE